VLVTADSASRERRSKAAESRVELEPEEYGSNSRDRAVAHSGRERLFPEPIVLLAFVFSNDVIDERSAIRRGRAIPETRSVNTRLSTRRNRLLQ
jgi:hypothetical protein